MRNAARSAMGNGADGRGSITAFYTVLTEGDDQQEPIADAARAILDGHIVLTRRIADAGQYPAQKIAAARITLESVRANWRQFFATYDFLVLPCAPFPAVTKAGATPEARRGILALTAPASLGGLPCLTVPVPLGMWLVMPKETLPTNTTVKGTDTLIVDDSDKGGWTYSYTLKIVK